MSEQPPSRPAQTVRLQRVTVRVPEDYAEDLRRFARELCTRQSGEPAAASATQWCRLSPSAEWLIDPECQARGMIRDTRAFGPNRFRRDRRRRRGCTGAGRYAGFGPWPTAGPRGITAFIAAVDGGSGPLAAFAGPAGDIRQVATAGERLPLGAAIGRFALNSVAVAGPGGTLGHLLRRCRTRRSAARSTATARHPRANGSPRISLRGGGM
jgi:hypothetical protein